MNECRGSDPLGEDHTDERESFPWDEAFNAGWEAAENLKKRASHEHVLFALRDWMYAQDDVPSPGELADLMMQRFDIRNRTEVSSASDGFVEGYNAGQRDGYADARLDTASDPGDLREQLLEAFGTDDVAAIARGFDKGTRSLSQEAPR